MNNNNVSDDLLIEILVNLPVQSLLRFKSACKSWYSFIDAPDFVHRHATMEDKYSNKLGTFIFHYLSESSSSSPVYPKKIDSYLPRFFSLSGDQFEVLKDLDVCPLIHEQSQLGDVNMIEMAGSCHGVVCLHNPEHGDVYLWNPATKQFRCIPKSLRVPDGPGFRSDRSDFACFGFDVKAKDYKVLKITSFLGRDDHGESYIGRAQVYSLNTNLWRYIDDPKIRAMGNQGARYLNGKYYFCGMIRTKDGLRTTSQFETAILSFDFSKETFRTIQIMEPGCSLEFIGEKVGFIKSKRGCLGGYIQEVWQLNECCGRESSTKRYILAKSDCLKAFSKDGDTGIMSDVHGLKMRNFVTQEVKELHVLENSMMASSAQVYKESLVSVERDGLLFF